MDKQRLQELAGIPAERKQVTDEKEKQLLGEIVQELEERGLVGQSLQEQQQLAAGLRKAGSAMGGAGGSVAQMSKGLEAAAAGERMPPAAQKALAPYAQQLMTILSDPQLSMKFKALVKLAVQKGQQQPQQGAEQQQGQEQQAQPQQGAEQVQQ